jgi:hypothetical protein
MIEKLKPQDDSEFEWIDEEGCSYKSKSEYLQTEVLGFCGCGSPDDVMGYVGSYLDDLVNNRFGDYEDIPYMFLAYWADHNGYTEHGSTVRCSWLTDKGKELLADINWCIKNEILQETNI